MGFDPATFAGFADELEKIAVSKSRLLLSRARKGRRPISVSNLLKKEKSGTLYKPSAYLDGDKTASMNSNEIAWTAADALGIGAKRSKKKGDTPSRDDLDAYPKKEDGRESAMVIPGTGQNYSMTDASNYPSERSE